MRWQYNARQQALAQSAWESSDILPYDAWLVRCWDECAYRDPMGTPVLLSAAQEQILWEQAIGSANSMPDDFPLLDLPATGAAAMQAWNLMHDWELQPNANNCRGEADAEVFLTWIQTVERTLRRNGWITRAELPSSLANRFRTGVLRIAGPVFFTGSHIEECPPSQKRCFETLRQSGCVLAERPIPPASVAQQGRAGFADLAEELQQAVRWARRKLENSPGAHIGIAIRGLPAVSRMMERTLDDAMHPSLEFVRTLKRQVFHIVGGACATDSPLIQAAFLALRLVHKLPLAEFGMLLRSPFITPDHTKVAALETTLRQQGSDEVSLHLPPVREAFSSLAAMTRRLPAEQTPGQWSAIFSQVLTAGGWPGERSLSEDEASAVEQWKDLLSDLAALDLVLGNVSYSEALQRLRGIAAQRQLTRHDADVPIQVMELEEAQWLRFDALWVAGLHDGVWPAPTRPTPFLPLALQLEAGATHSSPERELSHARQLTRGLLTAAAEVVVSYPLAAGEEALRPSPLIAGVPDITSTFCELSYPADWIALEELPPTPPLPLPEGVFQKGGVSVLADQAACPFQAFARHRLGATKADELALGISPSEKGNVAHKALELLWQELRSQEQLNARTGEELEVLIAQCVNTALDDKLSHRPATTSMEGFRKLEQSRLERTLADWLAVEKTRRPFVVVERETTHNVLAGGLELRIKADRVDEYPDGTCAIVDYKTASTLSRKMWDGDRPDAPQLPLYAVKSGRRASDVFFAKLVPGEVRKIGYEGAALTDHLPEWEQVIDRLGSEFREGVATVDPKKRSVTCKRCGLSPLCRVSELVPAVPEAGDEDEDGEGDGDE